MIARMWAFGRFFTSTRRGSLRRCGRVCFKVYNQVLGAFGGNDFEVAHARVLERQKQGKLPALFLIDADAFQAAVEWWCDAEEDELD